MITVNIREEDEFIKLGQALKKAGVVSGVEKNETGSKKGGQREMKKRLMMVMCCGIMILGNLSGCNAMKTKETEYHWPTSTLVKSLPVPESKYGEIVLDAEDIYIHCLFPFIITQRERISIFILCII